MRVLTLVILIITLITPIGTLGAVNNSNSEIDLTTYPGKVLFDLSNVKPGDSVSRNLVITNKGVQDFNYISSKKFLSGSEHFYNQLDLRVEDSKGIIYEGKLNAFTGLAPRHLKSKQNETLLFYVKIPMELGNEYQGISTEFQIKLFVEGTLGGVLPADGPRLPSTGTDMFNLVFVGAALVLGGGIFNLFNKRKQADSKR